jgi:L-alanine-DL-glutamate epimerase-like enolase superfamily enzyme
MAGAHVNVELWNLRVPLVPHIHSPRGAVTETCLLLVFASDGEGHRGVGYASFRGASDRDAATAVARKLVAEAAPGLAGLLNVERQQEVICENNAASRSAASALSLAAWDLAGKRAGVACADLWGRPDGRDCLDCYASALWLDKSPTELIAEAKMHRRNNYRLVKMRVSRSLEDNLERIAAVREVYTEPGTVALETGSEWTAAIANEFLDACSAPLLWIEDPEAHDKIHLVKDHLLNTIAAGEKSTSARELYDLYTRGRLRKLIIDVQYVGGPVRFLEAARTLNALGATVGAHRFSHYSMHLMASLPRSLPIEMLDWTNPAFHPLAGPDASGKLPVEGPGFRIQLDQAIIDRYGVKVTLQS